MDINKVGKVVEVPCKGNFFRWWFEILKPIHHLTSMECTVASALFYKRYELEKSITDPELLDSVLMQENCKKEIRNSLGITSSYFHVVLGKLKKAGIIQDGKLNKRFIPNIKQGETELGLLFIFDFK